MPRLSGVNLLGVLLAAIVMFFVGFVFYGMLFSEQWMAARGYTADMAADANPAWMAGGFLIELVLAFGLGWVLKLKGAKGLSACVSTALMLAVVVVLPVSSYEYVYGFYHSLPGLLVDWGHMLVGMGLAGAVLSFFD
ncbi:DUF1761 domain-containing protein [Hyphomonas sp.]|uniref:DUF1761 domain-containing protein n=1 Tax=Hyphomonas sp. TaxID=87 RepID=UPI0032EF7963